MLGSVYMHKSQLRTPQLKLRKREAKMSNAVLWLKLESSVKIFLRAAGVLQIVLDIAAVHQRFSHLRIALMRTAVIFGGFVQELSLFMNMPFQQRKVRLMRQNVFILRSER